MFSFFKESPSKIEKNVCLSCWKKNKDEAKKSKDKDFQDKIWRGQAFNNATISMLSSKLAFDTKEYWEEWDKRVAVFLNKIGQLQNNDH